MSKSLYDKLICSIEAASKLYFKLVILVGPSGSGKTRILVDVAKDLDTKVVNINLEVSALLLELTQKQRSLRLPQIIGQVISGEKPVMVLDNTEILPGFSSFDSYWKVLSTNPAFKMLTEVTKAIDCSTTLKVLVN